MAERETLERRRAESPEPDWTANPVASWLLEPGRAQTDPKALLSGLCDRLLAQGVPLARVSCGTTTLHPQVRGRQFVWRRGRGKVSEVRYAHGAEATSAYIDSPLKVLHQGAGAVRRRLDAARPNLDFPILRAMKEEGATDYVAMPLHFSSGRMGHVAWVTDKPGGFETAELSMLYGLLPLIALRVELEACYHNSRSLLETYLGRDAARRVLAGKTKRGEGRRIRAAILLADLRDFTAMSDRLPAEEVIALLDDYFDIMAKQVRRHRGEVLEIIGDGMLAVFDVDGSSRNTACCQAIHAALGAIRALEARNRRRSPALKVGIALHLGDVVYGNIGAADRLDFTVIGPAVNEAARIEGLCRTLDKPILASESFARTCTCEPLISLGRHPLRGVGEPQEIFALPPERLPR